jgi:hypothetical protein
MPRCIIITDAEIQAAARLLAHFMDFNESRWPLYSEITESMLRAAASARSKATK